MRLAAASAIAVTLLTAPAAAAAVQKAVFTEDSTGVSRMDAGDGLSSCVGYSGFVFEDRHGVRKVRVGTRDAHLEGAVHAAFRIYPAKGQSGVTFTGSYVEHDVGRFVPGDDSDTPSPNAMFQLRATARGDDGSLLRFHMIGQTHVDTRTGLVRRDRYTLSCSLS
jgi:hypothetical protein